jgi:antitoxin VapB
MPIARTRTFRSGNSEALGLPKDVAYGEDVELVIVRSGDVMLEW